jgi:hypothetical protein
MDLFKTHETRSKEGEIESEIVSSSNYWYNETGLFAIFILRKWDRPRHRKYFANAHSDF